MSVNVRLWSLAAIVCALACGGQTVESGSHVVGDSNGGKGPATGSSGFGGATPAGGSAGTSLGAGGSAPTTGGTSGSAGSLAAGRGGTGGGVSNGGTAGSAPSSGAAAGFATAGTAGSAGSGGQGTAGTAGDDSGTAGTGAAPIPPTWDTVKLVLSGTRPPCNGCHGNLGDGGFRITLDNDSQLFKSLTTTVVKDCEDNPIVTPGDPSKSALLEILQGDCSMNVPRMPPGCVDGDSGCVPPNYIAALSQWISDGAPWP